MASGRNPIVETAAGPVFVEVFNPPPALLHRRRGAYRAAAGADVALADYAVTVIDPRTAFATDARFPEIELSTEWPDEALERLKPDRRTAIVTLTHDPKLDDPALTVALRSDASISARSARGATMPAAARGSTNSASPTPIFARIHGPVGLDIGAMSPAEIAVSIIAQMTLVLRADGEAAEAA